jgi:hypothetical protein
MALSAEIKSMKDKGGKKNNKKGKDGNKGKRNNKRNSKKSGRDKLPKWKTTPPKDGESNTKNVKGKTLHWCPAHSQWVAHRPEDCKGFGTNKDNSRNSNNDSDRNKKPDHNRNKPSNDKKLQRAFNANVDSSDDDDE